MVPGGTYLDSGASTSSSAHRPDNGGIRRTHPSLDQVRVLEIFGERVGTRTQDLLIKGRRSGIGTRSSAFDLTFFDRSLLSRAWPTCLPPRSCGGCGAQLLTTLSRLEKPHRANLFGGDGGCEGGGAGCRAPRASTALALCRWLRTRNLASPILSAEA